MVVKNIVNKVIKYNNTCLTWEELTKQIDKNIFIKYLEFSADKNGSKWMKSVECNQGKTVYQYFK